MPARQAFYAESLSESTTTEQTWQDKCTLTFTPDANSTYWVLASWSNTSDATASQDRSETQLYHVEGAVALGENDVRCHELTSPRDWIDGFVVGRLVFGASPGQQNLKIQHSPYGATESKIRDARILVLEADAADQYAESLDWGLGTTSTSYVTKATLTFTPASTGDYLVIASAQIGTDNNGSTCQAQLNYVTGGQVFGDKVFYSVDSWDSQPFAAMAKLNLSAASKTFRIEYKTASAGVAAWMGNARILALRLDAFDNAYFADNRNVQATTAATYQDMLTLTATPQAVDHAILAIGAYNPASTTVSGWAQALQDATPLSEVVKESQNTAGYQYIGVVGKQTLANQSTTWKWQTKAETAGTTVNADELAIAVLQLGATPAAGTRRRQMAIAA
jgi:hypothetical protein